MIGKIFITSSGYDPQLGKHVKDPYLGPNPSLGACRPDIRRRIQLGGSIFVVSGKVPNVTQFVMGGFQVAEKIHAKAAYERFPERRLHVLEDGQLTGNVIISPDGGQHALDQHKPSTFADRLNDYIVGKNEICISSPEEIRRAREQTLDALRDILRRSGDSPHEVVGRWGADLDENQIERLRSWLLSLKYPE